MQLHGKKIILGITGSIAAFKATDLLRQLTAEGAEVRVVLTPSAAEFVSPLTLSTLSGNPVYQNFTKNSFGEWVNHVEFGLWADLLVIAPASARMLARMTTGNCDNLLTAVYLSAKCPVLIAPAMDLDMYAHPSTTRNLQTLKSFPKHFILEAAEGALASGLSGKGRMQEPEVIFQKIITLLFPKKPLAGFHVLLTAGPTQEPLDPVRYLTNHSTGKMGYAFAEAAFSLGAKVTLISGPVQLKASKGIQVTHVQTAEEMYQAAKKVHRTSDITIFSAAVADYTPQEVATEKIKKSEDDSILKLRRTPDIAALLGAEKQAHQRHIGFAMETENALENGRSKLTRKNFDLVVLNSLRDEGAGFAHDTNRVTLLGEKAEKPLPLMPKSELAYEIFEHCLRAWPSFFNRKK